MRKVTRYFRNNVAVGLAYPRAFNSTGDTLFLNGSIVAYHALVRVKLATGGWGYREKVPAFRNRQEEIDAAEISKIINDPDEQGRWPE